MKPNKAVKKNLRKLNLRVHMGVQSTYFWNCLQFFQRRVLKHFSRSVRRKKKLGAQNTPWSLREILQLSLWRTPPQVRYSNADLPCAIAPTYCYEYRDENNHLQSTLHNSNLLGKSKKFSLNGSSSYREFEANNRKKSSWIFFLRLNKTGAYWKG